MTQDEKWLQKYNEVMDFIVKNHRNPSRYRLEEYGVLNWIKHNRKVMNKGEMKEERVGLFKKLLERSERYRRTNQYV